ncbi:MAG: tetraacyldisaccharide 4-kinase [Alphaproteobacteria bacterium]|jgi:tetraacyldisaccharide 4'-kinase|nr:tetraacyldisaccharide 4-kinase [Alphaproteobacteria bacterium]
MREPSFWWRAPGIEAALLAPFAATYGAVAAQRLRRSGRKIGIPVICVGNLTVGGAGKTPTALAFAQYLLAAGQRPFFLSRGYGGRLSGPLRVDPLHHRADDVGDEPLLLARTAPTIIARDRAAGAEAAQAAGASVMVMDDGFQNPSLAKDFSVLVLDGRRGIGNGRVIPAGPLRAPLQAQLDHAHAMLVIGAASPLSSAVIAAAGARGIPIFHGSLEPDRNAVTALRGQRVLAFAGIGDPDKFFVTLTEAGIDVAARGSFPDHHRYSRADAEALLTQAASEDLLPVTTEKDLARIAGVDDLAALAKAARPLPATLRIDEEHALRKLLLAVLR